MNHGANPSSFVLSGKMVQGLEIRCRDGRIRFEAESIDEHRQGEIDLGICQIDPETLPCALGKGHEIFLKLFCVFGLPTSGVKLPGIFAPDALVEMHAVGGYANDSSSGDSLSAYHERLNSMLYDSRKSSRYGHGIAQ